VTLQRVIEAAGIPTVIIASLPTIAAQLGAPRIAATDTPLGAALGAPGDAEGQRETLLRSLRLLETATEPGVVTPLPVTYRPTL
jgi:D-proline reductase (dithiol) PrdA